MSLERAPQTSWQRVEAQNSADASPTSLAVQQSLQEIFDDFSVFISQNLRSQSPDDMD